MRYLLLLLIPFSGCWHYTSSPPFTHSREDVWESMYKVISRDYEIVSASQEDGELQSDWRFHMSHMYLQGYRVKVYAYIEEFIGPQENQDELPEEYREYLPVAEREKKQKEEQKTRYMIKIAATREQNRGLDEPASRLKAVWVPDGLGYDINEANRLINAISVELFLKKTDEDDEEENVEF